MKAGILTKVRSHEIDDGLEIFHVIDSAMCPFKPGDIRWWLNENLDFEIEVHALPNRVFRTGRDIFISPDDVMEKIYQEFRQFFNSIYIEPEDHIILGLE